MEIEEVFVVYAFRYLVSNFGNVDSLWFGKIKPIKTFITKQGYLRVSLVINGKQKSFLVHRLVAICFIPNPNDYKEVNHIDGNKLNNHVSNLEWCNRQQNIVHAWKLGLSTAIKGEKHGSAKITEAIVIEIFRLYNVENWTQQRIADHFWISDVLVSSVLRRKSWSTVDIPPEYL